MLKRVRTSRDNKTIKKAYTGTTHKGNEDEDSGYESNDVNAEDFALNTNSTSYDCRETLEEQSFYEENSIWALSCLSDFNQKNSDEYEENHCSQKVLFPTFDNSEGVDKENEEQYKEEHSNINNQANKHLKCSLLYLNKRRKHFLNPRRNFFRFIETTNKRKERSSEIKSELRSRSPMGHLEDMET